MSTGKLERLRFIDCLLAQYGQIRRGAVSDYFGLSTAQASADFAEYMRNAPDNMAYDVKAKAYVRTANFQRVFI